MVKKIVIIFSILIRLALVAANLAYRFTAPEYGDSNMRIFLAITAILKTFWYNINSYLGLSKNNKDSCTFETNINKNKTNVQTSKNNLNNKQLRKRKEKQLYIVPTIFFSTLFIIHKEHTIRIISTVFINRYYNSIASGK